MLFLKTPVGFVLLINRSSKSECAIKFGFKNCRTPAGIRDPERLPLTKTFTSFCPVLGITSCNIVSDIDNFGALKNKIFSLFGEDGSIIISI